MTDLAVCVATIAAFTFIEAAFGRAVAMGVSLTSLIACLVFLWHAGKNKAQP